MANILHFRPHETFVVSGSSLLFILLLSRPPDATTKIFTPCELAQELYAEETISWKLIADFVCIADAVTKLNSSFFQNAGDSRNYGIFRINNLYWCHDGFERANRCEADCQDLIGDDLRPSILCAHKIYRTSETGFGTWSDWSRHCDGVNVKEKYLRGCQFDTLDLHVAPSISTPPWDRNRTMTDGEKGQVLRCEASGNPSPDLEWIYDKTRFPELITEPEPGNSRIRVHAHRRDSSSAVLNLVFPEVTRNHDEAQFRCVAENIAGRDEALFTLMVESDSSQSFNFTAVGLPIIAFVIVLGVVTGGWAVKRLRQRRGDQPTKPLVSEVGLSKDDISEFKHGIPKHKHMHMYTPKNKYEIHSDLYVSSVTLECEPYDPAYELREGEITIDPTKVLGSGQFGVVLEAKKAGTGQLVAAKTVLGLQPRPEGRNRDYRSSMAATSTTMTPEAHRLHVKALLSELKVLIYLGREAHEHVVSLIGAHTTKLIEGTVFIFVEYCPLGDLEKYLKTRKHHFYACNNCGRDTERRLRSTVTSTGSSSTGTSTSTSTSISTCPSSNPKPYTELCELDPEAISPCDLLRWSTQVACAMEYLASRKVLHGDLAARNVLLRDRTCAKVTDFGLAKQLYNYTNYINKSATHLPWRSMPPESLRTRTFSTQSDVWAFGVTLWEIFNLGNILPYHEDAKPSMHFIHRLEDGERLPKPDYAPQTVGGADGQLRLYEDIMLPCWNLRPEDRPSFAELKEKLAQMEQLCNGRGRTGSERLVSEVHEVFTWQV